MRGSLPSKNTYSLFICLRSRESIEELRISHWIPFYLQEISLVTFQAESYFKRAIIDSYSQRITVVFILYFFLYLWGNRYHLQRAKYIRKVQYIKLGVILLLGISLHQSIAFSNKSINLHQIRYFNPTIKHTSLHWNDSFSSEFGSHTRFFF